MGGEGTYIIMVQGYSEATDDNTHFKLLWEDGWNENESYTGIVMRLDGEELGQSVKFSYITFVLSVLHYVKYVCIFLSFRWWLW